MAGLGVKRCSEDDCKNPVYARTLCHTHYYRHKRAGTLDQFVNQNEAIKAAPTRQRPRPAKRRLWSAAECLEDGCTAPPIARNLCGKHYQRRAQAGTLPPKIRVKLDGVPCEVSGCEKKAIAHRRCQSHASLARRYGLTTAQMEGLPTACEVCGSTKRLHVDHDHTTGAYRGVLCASCNSALGMLGDDLKRMRALIRYLQR